MAESGEKESALRRPFLCRAVGRPESPQLIVRLRQRMTTDIVIFKTWEGNDGWLGSRIFFFPSRYNASYAGTNGAFHTHKPASELTVHNRVSY